MDELTAQQPLIPLPVIPSVTLKDLGVRDVDGLKYTLSHPLMKVGSAMHEVEDAGVRK